MADETDQDPVVAANLRKLMKAQNIGGIGALRLAMAERGYKIGAGTIQRALQGGGRNRVETLSKLAEFFDVTTDQLLQADLGLDDTESDPAARTGQRKGDLFQAVSEPEWAMLQNYRRLLDKDRRAIDQEVAAKAEERQQEADELFARFGVVTATERANARRQAVAKSTLGITDRLKQRSLLDDENGEEET